ncbi:uncharacterized protein miip [Chiloscyllium punctatum]|uniref:Migration and invasion inhibitory protein n=1 Tax=Chiloscyllium punctatum TaxID=137246 RepID=A0A401SQR1_CHIPU|nr:hypothetical protein [Chiloscyllium punctatum]
MSHSDYLQSLRDQNKYLLQKLKLKQLKIPWNVLVPLESCDGPCQTAIKSMQSRASTDYQGDCNNRSTEQKCGNSLKNPNMKDQAHSERPGPDMSEDNSQQPNEMVLTESQKRREASRAALSFPLAHRGRKQGWTIGAGDGAGMEQSDWLLGSEARLIPNMEQNCSLSIGMSPKGHLNAVGTLDCEWNNLKPEARPRSTPCKLLTDCYVSKDFKCSTPFTKPPTAPRLMRESVYPASGQLCRDETNFKGSRPRHHSHFLQNFSENPKPRSKLEPPLYVEQLLAEGNDRQRERFIRDIQKPKPILLESHDKVAKVDMGHVTFLSPKEESSLRAQVQAVQPFLGYDWIAGLMDINSPMSEKSEQYFLDLQDFRRVNKDECVHQEYMEAEDLDFQFTGQEKLDIDHHVHQCTHSYRVNRRLFAVPLEPAAPCPVCKTPKAKQPHTLEEPAYIRVSIPRSTLLPPHKYKPHRRKSFDPTDSLSLPSHCLLGWRNTLPSTTPIANTLDLRSTVEAKKISSPLGPNLSNLSPAASRVAGGTRSDELLNRSRLTAYQFQRLRLDSPYSTFF